MGMPSRLNDGHQEGRIRRSRAKRTTEWNGTRPLLFALAPPNRAAIFAKGSARRISRLCLRWSLRSPETGGFEAASGSKTQSFATHARLLDERDLRPYAWPDNRKNQHNRYQWHIRHNRYNRTLVVTSTANNWCDYDDYAVCSVSIWTESIRASRLLNEFPLRCFRI